jgi:hypothetical protein
MYFGTKLARIDVERNACGCDDGVGEKDWVVLNAKSGSANDYRPGLRKIYSLPRRLNSHAISSSIACEVSQALSQETSLLGTYRLPDQRSSSFRALSANLQSFLATFFH